MHIRILSPSGPIDPEYIDAAKQRLESWGHVVTEGRYARDSWGRFAATDAERISDLNEAFADPSIDAILCSRGGYGLQRILDKIKPTSKLVIGFSDITALHQLMHSMGVPSLHAIMCKHIATLPDDNEALQLFKQSLLPNTSASILPYNRSIHPLNRPGKAVGTLIGGNLSVLYGLQGTPYSLTSVGGLSIAQPAKRSILFLEDIGERHYHIDRMMQNLRMSGVLANISGLIVGQFTDCDPDEGMRYASKHSDITTSESIYETILRAVEDYDYPVVFNFPAGHVEDNHPIWLGKTVELEVTPNISRLTYAHEHTTANTKY